MGTGLSIPLDTGLQGIISQLHGILSVHPGAPSEKALSSLCDILYSASLLKEEGRAVRARVIVAPPGSFTSSSGPPEGIHAVRFTMEHGMTANEIKRLCPAASFFHSVVAVWPDKHGDFKIWGVLNTGPRWMNLVAGGRKPLGDDIPFPIMHVRDPGWVLFYQGYTLLAEWRGRELFGPRLDVFQSKLLNDRFAKLRLRLVEDLPAGCLPPALSSESYADLCHLIAIQFIKRIINLVRSSSHGGTLIFLPEGETGAEIAAHWIDCKYSAEATIDGMRFHHLLQKILRRVGQLTPPGATLEEAWQIFRNSNDPELDRLEEAFFELARFFSDLMQVDGALVLDQTLSIIGFGGEIRVDQNVFLVGLAQDLDGSHVSSWDVRNDGTRHRAVYRLCSVEPEVMGWVISQDSYVRFIANIEDSVVFWMHTVI
ncbi:MAG: hypothetical protein JWO82_3966 [Akkermansiaceae bacterium]|nr:hypothetical protein [Akkermansiaceae bacterium]